jgi:mono/diheme cytochrome c family protein
MAMRFGLWWYGLASLPLASAVALRTDPVKPSKVDAERSIGVRSILKARCGSCHGAQDPSAGLDLTSDKAILSSGLIRAGDAKASVLMRRVQGMDGKPRMPLGFSPLSAAELATLSDWINQGAKFVAGPKAHWAYVSPIRPALPKVSDPRWCRNEIDRFVLAKLDRAKLKPSAEASRVTLIRRLSLDLIGLPPTPAEVDAFLADRSPLAYERVVDRLLKSPQYGERQARPWLDLARYADTNGYEADYSRTM